MKKFSYNTCAYILCLSITSRTCTQSYRHLNYLFLLKSFNYINEMQYVFGCEMCTVSVFKFYTATSLLIKSFSVKYESHSMQMMWLKPYLLPTGYRLLLSCKNVTSDQIYTEKEQYLISDDVFVFTYGIYPNSRCETNFLAMYNPASIDRGISRTILTSPASEYSTFRARTTCSYMYVCVSVCACATVDHFFANSRSTIVVYPFIHIVHCARVVFEKVGDWWLRG